MRMLTWVAAAAIVVAACNGGGPTGTGGGNPEGSYNGTHTFTVGLGGQSLEVTCTGSTVIIDVTGATLNGTLTVNPCQNLSLETAETLPISGSISGSQIAVTFPQEEFLALLAGEGCTITRADQGFAGTLVGGRILADFTATATCEDVQGNLDFAWHIDMQKA